MTADMDLNRIVTLVAPDMLGYQASRGRHEDFSRTLSLGSLAPVV